MRVMSPSTRIIAHKKALLGLLGALAFSTGCESPFLHKNEVSANSPLVMDSAQSSLKVSGNKVVAGSQVGILLSVRDQNGTLWVDSKAQVSFTFSGGASAGTISSIVNNKDGTYTALLTGVTAGTPSTVSAVINGTPLTRDLPQVTVLAGPASIEDSIVVVSAPRISAGSSANLKFIVTDKYGNPIGASEKGRSVGFDYSGSSRGTVGPVTDNLDGTYSAVFTGTVAGDPSVFVAKERGVSVGTRKPPSVQVISAGPNGNSMLTVSLNEIASGSASTITLVSTDMYGNPAGSGRSVVFTSVGGTSTGVISPSQDSGQGTYTATFTGVLAGTETTIHAKIDGVEVVTTLPQVRVHAGLSNAQKAVISAAASVVPSGTSTNVFLTLKDANENIVDQSGLAVVFSYSGGTSTGIFSPATYQGGGVYSSSFTGVKAGTAVKIGATLGGAVAGNGMGPSISVVPGAYSPLLSLISVSAPSVLVNNSVLLSLLTKDANGNSLVAGGLPVSFGYLGGTSTGTIGSVNDAGNGTYSAFFRGTGSGSPIFITAAVGSTPILSASPSLVVNPAIASLALSTVSVSSPTVASGNQVILTLTVKDSAGMQVKDSAMSVAFTRTGGTSTGVISSASYNAGPGTYTATFTGVLAGTPTSIGATIGGFAITSVAPTITVTPGPAVLGSTTISVPTNTVSSGSSIPVSITLRDASGNPVPNGGLTVTVSNQGGTSQGTFSSVTYAGTGVYSTNFTGTAAGTPTTLGATVSGVAASPGPQVTVIPGPFSLAQSVISAAPTTILSGEISTLTLIAKDAFGNLLPSGGLTVAFGQSIAGMGQIGATVDSNNGSYSAPFTGVVAGGPDLITATINGGNVTSQSPGISVLPSAISLGHTVISVSAPSVVSGEQATLKLSLRDSANNRIKQPGMTVVFNQGGGTSTGTIGDVSYSEATGEYSAPFTGVVAGTPTQIGASLGEAPVTSASPSITVVAGPLSLADTSVSTPESSVSAGSSVPVSIVPKDAAGNPIVNETLVIVFIYVGGTSQGTFGPVTYSNGTYTANFTGTLAGTPITLGATIDGNPVTGTGPGITVMSGSYTLAQSNVSVSPSSISSGGSATVSLAPRDAFGNSVVQSELTVVFAQGGGTSTGSFGPVNYDPVTGIYSATFTGLQAGTPTTLGSSISGQPVTSAGPAIAVVPGAYSLAQSTLSRSEPSVPSGGQVSVALTLKDANGNQVNQSGLEVAFSTSGGTSTGIFGAVSFDSSSGVYSAIFTGVHAGTATTFGASIGGQAVTSAGPTEIVTSGAPSLTQSSVSVSSSSVSSGSSIDVTLTVRDANGNPVNQSGLVIAFSSSGGTSTGVLSSTGFNSGSGTYSGSFTGVLAGTATQIGASIGGSSLTSSLPSVTVLPGALSLANSAISTSASTVVSGGTATLTLAIKDAAGNLLGSSGDGLTVLFNVTGGTSSGSISGVQNSGASIYTATFTGVHAGSALNIGATVGGSAISSPAPQIAVTPGNFALAQSQVSVSAGSVSSGGQITVSLSPKDSNSNEVMESGLTVAFSASGGTSTGSFGAVSYNAATGVYSATFTGLLAGTATSIGAFIHGSAVTSPSPSVTVTAGALALAQTILSVSSSSVVSGSQITVSVSPKDSNGNAVIQPGLTVVLSASGGTSTGSFSPVSYNSGTGVYGATFTGLLAGTATSIGASINSSAVTSPSPSVTVTAGTLALAQSVISVSSSSVTSGGQITVSLSPKDANSNSVIQSGLNVVFSALGGTSTGSFSVVSYNSSTGVYSGTFTGLLAGTATNIGASINSSAVTSASPPVTVIPGGVSLANSTLSVSSPLVASGSAITLTLNVYDSNGNHLTSGGLGVVFSQSIAGLGSFGGVVDSGNGTYSVSFTGITVGGPNTLSVTIGGQALSSALPSVTIVPGPISLANSSFSATPTTLTNGGTSALVVTARDANNNLTSGGGTISFSIASGTGSGTFSAVADGSNGLYTSTFTATGAGSLVLQASINGTTLSSTVSMTINSSGMSIEVPIEMIDTPVGSKTADVTFELSRTPIETTNYDGSPQYFIEIVAGNADSSNRTVTLVDSSGNAKSSFSIPANSAVKRYRQAFTPNTGSDQYRIRLSGSSGRKFLIVYASRILIQQTNATKTKLYVPMLGNVYSDTTAVEDHWIDRVNTNVYGQAYPTRYMIWKKDLNNLATVASGNSYQLDTVLWAKDNGSSNFWWNRNYCWDDENFDSNGSFVDDDDENSRQNVNNEQCSAALFNMQSGLQVSGTSMSTAANQPTFLSSSFPDSATNFPDQTNYEVRIKKQGSSGQCYIGKAGLWVTLNPLVKGEVYYRVSKGYSWSIPNAHTDTSRIYLDLGLFSAGNVSTYYETTGYGSSGSNLAINMRDGGTNDSGSSSSAISCGSTSSALGNSRGRYRSSACSGVVNGHRYYHGITSGSGSFYSGSSCMVVNFK